MGYRKLNVQMGCCFRTTSPLGVGGASKLKVVRLSRNEQISENPRVGCASECGSTFRTLLKDRDLPT